MNENGNSTTAASLKFLFISNESLSGDLALALIKEGHEVKMYIKAKSDSDVYNGFVEKVSEWAGWVDWCDIVVFDHVGFGEVADKLRKKQKKVIGGSAYTDRLEIEREFGQNEMRNHGINVLPSWTFSNYDEALEFIKNNPSRYVFKPNGNTPSSGKGLLFLGEDEDGKDLYEMLSQNKDVWQKKAPVFHLQRYASGVEVAVGVFFNGHDFILPINVNFEHKRIFPGDIGSFTGDMGALMFWNPPNMLFRETLQKMLPALQESGYIGYIDINCIVNGRGIYPLEFTARFGYPTIFAQLEAISMPIGELFQKLVSAEPFEVKVRRGFQIAVEVYIPTYFTKNKDKEAVEIYRDLPVLFKKANHQDGVHIQDVKLEDGSWRIAGESGSVLVVTGSGNTVEEARRQAYARIQNIMIQNMFYRGDIGSKWMIDGDKLQTWGYLS